MRIAADLAQVFAELRREGFGGRSGAVFPFRGLFPDRGVDLRDIALLDVDLADARERAVDDTGLLLLGQRGLAKCERAKREQQECHEGAMRPTNPRNHAALPRGRAPT